MEIGRIFFRVWVVVLVCVFVYCVCVCTVCVCTVCVCVLCACVLWCTHCILLTFEPLHSHLFSLSILITFFVKFNVDFPLFYAKHMHCCKELLYAAGRA